MEGNTVHGRHQKISSEGHDCQPKSAAFYSSTAYDAIIFKFQARHSSLTVLHPYCSADGHEIHCSCVNWGLLQLTDQIKLILLVLVSESQWKKENGYLYYS